jgi:hypothetical protein
MCLAVYTATNKELELGTFVADQTVIYFEKLSDECRFRSKLTPRSVSN